MEDVFSGKDYISLPIPQNEEDSGWAQGNGKLAEKLRNRKKKLDDADRADLLSYILYLEGRVYEQAHSKDKMQEQLSEALDFGMKAQGSFLCSEKKVAELEREKKKIRDEMFKTSIHISNFVSGLEGLQKVNEGMFLRK